MTKLNGSQAEYARHHDVSRQTVTDWKTRGLLAFADNGDVDFEASDRALADHGIRQPELTQVDDESFEQAFARFVESGQAVLTKAEAERVARQAVRLTRRMLALPRSTRSSARRLPSQRKAIVAADKAAVAADKATVAADKNAAAASAAAAAASASALDPILKSGLTPTIDPRFLRT